MRIYYIILIKYWQEKTGVISPVFKIYI